MNLSLLTRAALLVAACSATANANVGVFNGSGHTVKLTETAEIQMVRERVEILPHRGPRLFTGGLPTDRVDFDCTFVLRNLKDAAVSVQVGFPLDSQFENAPYDPKEQGSGADLVHDYRFIARDSDRTYHTTFQPYTDEFGSTFLWSMDFAPGETRTLRVTYSMDMSVSLADLSRGGDRETRAEATKDLMAAMTALPWLQGQAGAFLESFQYITKTGASWAGTIEHAEFIVHTWLFDEYLTARAPMEASHLLPRQSGDPFSGTHPTRFVRDIAPAGYKAKPLEGLPAAEGSIQWTFAPFEPGPLIVGRYFKSTMPSTPEGARAQCKEFMEKHGADPALVRQYFAAWMGFEPADETLRKFCASLRWYEPVDDIAEADLSANDRAILAAIDNLK